MFIIIISKPKPLLANSYEMASYETKLDSYLSQIQISLGSKGMDNFQSANR